MKIVLVSTLRRAATTIVACGLLAVIALSTPSVAGMLFSELQRYPAIAPAQLPEITSGASAAIVILSAGRRTFAPEFGSGTMGTVDALSLELRISK